MTSIDDSSHILTAIWIVRSMLAIPSPRLDPDDLDRLTQLMMVVTENQDESICTHSIDTVKDS